jgi:hypothetical protein
VRLVRAGGAPHAAFGVEGIRCQLELDLEELFIVTV